MAKHSASAGEPSEDRDPTREKASTAGTRSNGGTRREPAKPTETSSRASTTDDYERSRRADSQALMDGDHADDEDTDDHADDEANELPEDPPAGETDESGQTPEKTDEPADGETPADEPPDEIADDAKLAEDAVEAEKLPEEEEPDEDALTEHQIRLIPKTMRKQLKRVFESRAKARKELEALKPKASVVDLIDADLKEAGITFPILKQRMEFEKALSKMTPQQKAAEFRRIADQFDPAGSQQAPKDLDEDLTTLRDANLLPAEDIQEMQRLRAARKGTKAGETTQTQQNAPGTQPERQFLAADAPWTADEETVGKKALDTLDKTYAKRYPADWPKLAPIVSKEIANEAARIKQLTGFKPRPENWEKLAREITERVIKRHKAPQKTPPKSLGSSRPAGPPPKRGYLTREEQAAELMQGS